MATALLSAPPPNPNYLSLCAWCSLLPDFSAPTGSTQAVSLLPAAGTCLARKTSCNEFEPTEMPRSLGRGELQPHSVMLCWHKQTRGR